MTLKGELSERYTRLFFATGELFHTQFQSLSDRARGPRVLCLISISAGTTIVKPNASSYITTQLPRLGNAQLNVGDRMSIICAAIAVFLNVKPDTGIKLFFLFRIIRVP